MTVTLMGENFNPERRTIKNNGIFLVTDHDGNVLGNNTSGHGLYMDDTRFLSRLELKMNDNKFVILSSSTESGHSSIIIGTNPHIPDAVNTDFTIPQETIQIKREAIIYGSYFETVTVENFNFFQVNMNLEFFFGADFLDVFEVRNLESLEKGVQKEPIYEDGILKFVYQDNTGATLTTEIVFIEDKPVKTENGFAIFDFALEPNSKKEIKYQINLRSTASLPEKISAYDFDEAFEKAIVDDKKWNDFTTTFYSNNQDFNEMVVRGNRDINMLRTRAHYGEYIAAGIPWFTTLFGRDSIITARQALILNPMIAKNVLETLARFQGKEYNDWRDEEPGKIPHEIRFGELARANVVPHIAYYGTVDATPLWVMLLYDYFKWTNDKETLERLWINALNCRKWMDEYALYNGYAAYKKRSEKGLDNQSWKDSFNSNVHQDGSLAEPPISPVEVQGYIYAAKMQLAELADCIGEDKFASILRMEAKAFKHNFNKDFWMEDEQFFCMGLDKDGKQMKVVTSNPGHCLETGIIEDQYVTRVAERMFENDMFNGWGIRTLSSNALVYNPMSYHNGSVWPHDNSIIAYGLSKIGRDDLALNVTSSLFEAARRMKYKRLPELFCGFNREFRRQDPPVRYPVACIPQAWAAASVFWLIQSMLSIEPDAQKNELRIFKAQLPDWLTFLKIDNLTVGQASVDMEFKRSGAGLIIDIIDKRGKLDIYIKK